MLRAIRTRWLRMASPGRGRLADDVQTAGPLAIQAEILRAGHGDRHLRQLGAEQPDAVSILGDTAPEPLVGDINERRQRAALEHIQQLTPLGLAEISTRRVVTGSVQQDDGARRQAVQRPQHLVELHASGRGIEVGIPLQLQPTSRQQRNVVRPRRRADVNNCVRLCRAEELGPQSQRAASAGRLDRAHPIRGQCRMPFAQDEPAPLPG